MSASVATSRNDLLEWCRAGLAAHPSIGEVRQQPWQLADGPMVADRLAKELVALDDAVVVLGHDMPVALALEVAAVLDRDHPAVSTILIAPSDTALWREALRAGVRDVVEPGALGTDLRPALERAVERAHRNAGALGTPLPPPQAPTGRVIVVMAPKGGCGKTTVASNLACALAALEPGRVAAVDLDVQFGDLAVALGLQPERTLPELAQAGTLDATTVKLHLTPFDPGLYVLCGSTAPEDADLVADHHVTSLVRSLAREFAYVVVDTPAGIDLRTLAAIEQCTDLMFVTSLDVSSLRSLRKGIETLDRLGFVQQARHVVLNRADAKVGLTLSDVETVLGMAVGVSIPSTRAVPLSMNMGEPLAKSEPGSPVGREFVKLARSLGAGATAAAGRRFALRRER